MGNEPIDVEEEQDIKAPEVKTSLQAIVLIWQGVSFLWVNYRLPLIVVVVILFIAVQIFFTNFQQIKDLASLVGVKVG